MTKDFELRRSIYIRELEGSRNRETERSQHMTFFYTKRTMEAQIEEEIEHAVKYNHWRLK